MTGIIKTDQLQGAQSSTITVPSGNNLTVGGTVGIGETTPLGKLHVKSGDSGASSVNANANELVIENSDYTGITILGENESNICFGDNEDPDVGRIEYHHSDNSMRFRTNASDRMHITSAGNVLVGTTNANPAEQNVAGIGLLAGNSISVTDDGGAPIQLNRKSSDGSIAIFRRDGSSKGNIGTNGGDLYIAGTTHGLKFDAIDASTMYIRPVNNSGTNLTGQIDLGQAGNVFRDAYVSGGVYFAPNAYPANYLDDYEEGTFTPTLQGSGDNFNPSYTHRSGQYTKVGNRVHFDLRVASSARTENGDQVYIGGLPFSANYGDAGNTTTCFIIGNGIKSDYAKGVIYAQANNTNSVLTVLMSGYNVGSAAGIDNFRQHDLYANHDLRVSGSYSTNS